MIMPDKLSSFHADFSFADGISASVCGFCTGEPEEYTRAILSLAHKSFHPLSEGILIDARFSRLLREALSGLPPALIGGSVRVSSPDGPCGAVIGLSDSPPESPGLPIAGGTFAGRTVHYHLFPGIGAQAVIDSPGNGPETGLWVLDYRPGFPDIPLCRIFPAPG